MATRQTGGPAPAGMPSGDTVTAVLRTAALRAELAETRTRGYAVSRGERQHGAGSVAAPVFGPDGQPQAVISVCGPVERFTPHMDRAATLLCQATRRLSQQPGHWT